MGLADFIETGGRNGDKKAAISLVQTANQKESFDQKTVALAFFRYNLVLCIGVNIAVEMVFEVYVFLF